MFLDSHCHLDDAVFDADRDAVIERARAAGLVSLLTIGGAAGPDRLAGAVEIAERHEWIYAAAGIHPHEAAKAEDRHFDELRCLARHAKFLAIGEIGLDYHYDHSPRDVQEIVFVRQLDLARELKLPVIIHCRDAWADLRRIIRERWTPEAEVAGKPADTPAASSVNGAGQRGILHCFTGTLEDARELMALGFLVSFAGNLTFKKADDLRAVASEIPLDRLLTETDSPYLAPVPHRGKRNEPARVIEVTRELARLHGVSHVKMGQHALRNFARFFRLG